MTELLPDPAWFAGAVTLCTIGLIASFWVPILPKRLLIEGIVLFGACSVVGFGYESKGEEKTLAKWDPVIKQCAGKDAKDCAIWMAQTVTDLATSQANEATLKKAVADANLYVEQLQVQVKGAKDRAAAAIASAQTQAKLFEATIADLSAKESAPPTTDLAEACRQAQAVFDKLFAGAP